MGYFERSIAIDSEFIPAYYGLGVAYIMQVVDVQVPVAENRGRLRELLSRGLRLAPDDPGLLALSAQLARYDGEIQLAGERFATALQRDPSNGVVRILYAMFKLDQGDPEEALRLTRRSFEIDPFNPITYVVVWASHLDLWHEKEAMVADHQRHQKRCNAARAAVPGHTRLASAVLLRHRRSANGRRPDGNCTTDRLQRMVDESRRSLSASRPRRYRRSPASGCCSGGRAGDMGRRGHRPVRPAARDRAVGDEAGANQMLDHLDAVLALRRTRGLFIEERHAAEALALRGRTEAALDALEKAERDRTIYHWWQLELLHNEIFAGLRNHPRFVALVERIRSDLSRQRDELSRVDPVARDL